MQRHRFAFLLQKVLMAALLAATTILAQAGTGPYVGGEGAANFVRPQNLWDEPEQQGDSNYFGRVRYWTGYVGGLLFGYTFDIGLRPELELAYRRDDVVTFMPAGSSTNIHAQGGSEVYQTMANLWYDIPTGSIVRPYIGLGIGGVRLNYVHGYISGMANPPRSYDSVFAYQGGAGVGFDLTRHLTLSVDYRYLQSNIVQVQLSPGDRDGRYRADSAGMSLRYSFGGEPPPVTVAVVKEEVVPPPPPPPPDPCAQDSDHDGVNDCLDKCPNTPRGFKVDANGCIIEQTVILRGVNFEFNSDRLTQPSRDTLNDIATGMVSQPSMTVEIDGHTDATGSRAYNQGLSERRANAVLNYLVSQHVNGASLTARGFGKDHPIMDNATEDGRTANRRVEFIVLHVPAQARVIQRDPTSQSKAAASTEPERIKRLYEQGGKSGKKRHRKHKQP